MTHPLREQRPQVELTTRDVLAFDLLKVIIANPNARPDLYPHQYAGTVYTLVDFMLAQRDK